MNALHDRFRHDLGSLAVKVDVHGLLKSLEFRQDEGVKIVHFDVRLWL